MRKLVATITSDETEYLRAKYMRIWMEKEIDNEETDELITQGLSDGLLVVPCNDTSRQALFINSMGINILI